MWWLRLLSSHNVLKFLSPNWCHHCHAGTSINFESPPYASVDLVWPIVLHSAVTTVIFRWFLMLVWAFLVGPLSPTDFSDGLPMDWEQTNTLSQLEMTGKHQWKSSRQPVEVQWNSNGLLLLLLYNIKKPPCHWIEPSTSGAHEDNWHEC